LAVLVPPLLPSWERRRSADARRIREMTHD
jgi:hypothetical protein